MMLADKVGNRALRLQRAQRLENALVVHSGKVEGCLDLTSLHITDECVNVPCSRVPDAVSPDGIEMMGNSLRQSGQVGLQVPVAIGLKYQILRLQMFLTSRHADVDHIIHDHQSRQVRARRKREWTVYAHREFSEILANLQIMRRDSLLVVDDRRQNRQAVHAAALVCHNPSLKHDGSFSRLTQVGLDLDHESQVFVTELLRTQTLALLGKTLQGRLHSMR